MPTHANMISLNRINRIINKKAVLSTYPPSCTHMLYLSSFFSRVGIVGGLGVEPPPQFMSTEAHFLSENQL